MRWIISTIVILAVAAGLWWMLQPRHEEPAPPAEPDIPEQQRPEPRYPLPEPEKAPAEEVEAPDDADRAEPEATPEPPLPDLADSDPAALETLAELVGNDFMRDRIKPEFVIARSAALINSLDGSAPALKSRPIEPLDSEPLTEEPEGGSEALLWTEANAQRYDAAIAALESIEPEKAAALYARYHPLFQQAWEELGESEPWFNDRLVDIIDHLLAAPEVALPFEVVPYEGRLNFADESLQSEPWGRKLLIRMGPEHATTVKQWLREFRREIADRE